MPIPNWSIPFDLLSVPYAGANLLLFNVPIDGLGIYILDEAGCSLDNLVRSSKEPVPQADGEILHTRFVAGMEMKLAIQLWQDPDTPACDDLLEVMLDTLMGYLYGLLNAGDNQGRITWDPPGQNDRMLDDLRLLTYPIVTRAADKAIEVAVTVDCPLPYAENEEQIESALVDSAFVGIPNEGNRPTYPTWRIFGPFSGFTLTLDLDGSTLTYDENQPGAPSIGAGEYIEINTFRNTAYKVEAGPILTNALPGFDMATSEFFLIPAGGNDVEIVYTGGGGGASVGLTNAAWA